MISWSVQNLKRKCYIWTAILSFHQKCHFVITLCWKSWVWFWLMLFIQMHRKICKRSQVQKFKCCFLSTLTLECRKNVLFCRSYFMEYLLFRRLRSSLIRRNKTLWVKKYHSTLSNISSSIVLQHVGVFDLL